MLLDPFAAYNGVNGIVSTLDQNVGYYELNKLEWSVLIEDRDSITRPESCEQCCAIFFVLKRSLWTFDASCTFVRIKTDDQHIAHASCFRKIGYMTCMQNIEHAIGED